MKIIWICYLKASNSCQHMPRFENNAKLSSSLPVRPLLNIISCVTVSIKEGIKGQKQHLKKTVSEKHPPAGVQTGGASRRRCRTQALDRLNELHLLKLFMREAILLLQLLHLSITAIITIKTANITTKMTLRIIKINKFTYLTYFSNKSFNSLHVYCVFSPWRPLDPDRQWKRRCCGAAPSH